MTRPDAGRRRGRLALSARFAATVVVAAGLGACGVGEDDRSYCGDENRVVVHEQECDTGSPFVASRYVYVGSYPGGLAPGQVVPGGGERVAASSPDARARAGLPARGGFGSNGGRCCGG